MDTLFSQKRMSKISLVGLGRSNTPLVPFLLSRGFFVEVFDQRPVSALPQDTRRLLLACRTRRLTLRLSDRGDRPFSGDIVLRSPGLRPSRDARLLAARQRGACVTTEAGLFLRHTQTPVLAVTGSDGKSTTSVSAAHILKTGGHRVFLGGNIGRPLLPSLGEREHDVTVAELSSFQLFDAPSSPDACVFTNLSENHLNWHTSLDEYLSAKENGLRHARRRILSADCPMCDALLLRYPSAALFSADRPRQELLRRYGARDMLVIEEATAVHYEKDGKRTPLFPCAALALLGRHNLKNFMAAALLTLPYVMPADIESAARDVRALPHRMEFVLEKDGVRFYNSSVDSSPARTAATLAAFDERVILLLGGQGKRLSYRMLPPLLAKRAKAVFLSGENRAELESALRDSADFRQSGVPVFVTDTMERAVAAAAAFAKAGDSVLLSPAATAFDAYQNYAVRGDAFRRAVHAIYGLPAPTRCFTELDGF